MASGQLHEIRLTPGHVDRQGRVEPPWKCVNCGRYFHRHPRMRATCKPENKP